MLNKQQRLRALQRRSEPKTLGSPIKGWNTRDPFEAMDPLDAIVLDNWYPDFGGLNVRNGSVQLVSGLGGVPVSTLATFTGTSERLFAACANTIYDVTTGTATTIKAGLSADLWQTAMFSGHQFWVNGVDQPQIFDGSTMSVAGFTDAPVATMKGIGVFNNRLYFWDGAAAGFWYGGVSAIAGPLSYFDLSMASIEGGSLIAIEVLSYDGGTGVAAYTCFFMSSGEVLMYSGTDPSNFNNWALVGRYTIAPPAAMRAITRYGGDIYLATANDHQQLSQLLIALRLGQVPPRSKISGAATKAYLEGAKLPGWQALYYPRGQRIIFNVPQADGTIAQHVYNTATQAWCRFTGNNAYCFGVCNGALYYGAANGVIYQADTGSSDNGTAIAAQAQQAWQLFDTPLKKRVTAVRPVVQSQGVADFTFSIGFDYQPAQAAIPDATLSTENSLVWGSGQWGLKVWGGSGVTDPRWHIASGEGAAIGLAMAANSSLGATWIRTDFMIEPGSAL